MQSIPLLKLLSTITETTILHAAALPLWLSVHVQRAIAVLVTVAIGVPLFHYLPLLYKWNMRRRLFYWCGQLKALEASFGTYQATNI